LHQTTDLRTCLYGTAHDHQHPLRDQRPRAQTVSVLGEGEEPLAAGLLDLDDNVAVNLTRTDYRILLAVYRGAAMHGHELLTAWGRNTVSEYRVLKLVRLGYLSLRFTRAHELTEAARTLIQSRA